LNFLNIEQILKSKIIGQERAILAISKAIQRASVGLNSKTRPIASFIFCGSTGVGKTEITKALASALFGTKKHMIRFDMSEYMEKSTITKLLGSAPGYSNYEQGGRLINQIKKTPHTILLFDEIEKAHLDIFNILLQVLDEGQLTDSKGQIVSFRKTIIILTSNIGTKEIKNLYTQNKKQYELYFPLYKIVVQKLNRIFRSEFLNRFDKIIIFTYLTIPNLIQITKIIIKKLQFIVKKKGITLEITNTVIKFLAKRGFYPTQGARALKRIITYYIEDKITEILIKRQTNKQVLLIYLTADNKINITQK
jgi:ATP-dependent Clp protease ATP-binding subunit ClpC